jgi:type I restriction enzyme S subunit
MSEAPQSPDAGQSAGPDQARNAGPGGDQNAGPGDAGSNGPEEGHAPERPALELPGLPALPPGWTLASLAELAHGRGRYGSAAPAQAYDARLPRYVRITDIDDSGRLRPDSWASIPESLAEPHRLQPGDLLFARSGATAGKTYLYDPDDGACAHGGYLVRFALRDDRCAPRFVAQWTLSRTYWTWLRATLRQAAQPNINAAELAALPVPQPPLDEQRAIVRILDTCDQVIDASARILEKLGRILASMVRDLLTRGVVMGEGGRMRDPGREPGAFHDTPLGRLPRDWQVVPVGRLLADVDPAMRSGPFGSELRKSELVSAGVPLLGIDNVQVDEFVPAFRRFVRPEKLDELRRYAVRPGDVLITIMGTVGRSCVVPHHIGDALSSKHIWTLTFDHRRYVPLLASLQFNHAPWVEAHFTRGGQGGTMTAIRSDILRSTLLPVPPIEEQHCIVHVLERLRARIAAERALLAMRERLRERLREDLVTGRVRIGDPAAFAAIGVVPMLPGPSPAPAADAPGNEAPGAS